MKRAVILSFAFTFAACLSRVDPHEFENYASRIELLTQVTNLGGGPAGVDSRVMGQDDVVAVFSVDFEIFMQLDPESGTYSVLTLRPSDRDVSHCSPFRIGELVYMTTRKAGTELAAGFGIRGNTVGTVISTARAPMPVVPTGVGYGDERGYVFILREPAEMWIMKPDGVTIERKIPLTDPDSYYAVNRLPNGVIMAVQSNAVFTVDPVLFTYKTTSLERASQLPVTRNIPSFGAVLPYQDNSAFVVEGGRTIYTVVADTYDTVTVTTRQEKAIQARSLAFNEDRTLLVVANGVGGVALYDAKNPEALLYLNRASTVSIGGYVAYMPGADAFAVATTPIASVYKIFTP